MTHQLVLLLFCAIPVASAQQISWSHLVSDSNSPTALMTFAVANLGSRKDSLRMLVDSALMRAARLDPVSGRPSYLLAVATLLPAVQKSRSFFHSSNLWRHLSAQQTRRLDSLLTQSFLREPFIDILLDPILAPEELAPPEAYGDPDQRAYVAYQAGRFDLALNVWTELLERSPERIDLRWHRANILYRQRQYDGVVVTLEDVLAQFDALTDSVELPVLPPTDIIHYAIGIAEERAGRPDAAVESYRRTLLDNLGMYMARVRLSAILLARGDTLEALREISIAVDVAPEEPLALAQAGALLVRVGRAGEALVPLEALIRRDPSYATPYLVLGLAYSDLGRDPEALHAFEGFLQHAAKTDERRAWVNYRVTELRTNAKK